MSNPKSIAKDGTVRDLQYTHTPRFIQIETTLACNAKCPFCPYVTMNRSPKFMEDWIWRKIVDETRDLGITYRPFLINEPLSEKRLSTIIDYIKEDRTARVEINSNGGLLTKKRGQELLDAGIDIVRFSIDGFSQETYNVSRVGIDYKKTVANVSAFIEMRNAGKHKTFIEVRCIDMKENKHEQSDYLDYWTPRADNVVITPLYAWPWSGQKSAVRKPCLKILDEMFFYTDGTAPLCCWDDAGRGIIGDVKTQAVLEIWNGPEMQSMRTLLDRGRRDLITLCSRCDAYKDLDFILADAPDNDSTTITQPESERSLL